MDARRRLAMGTPKGSCAGTDRPPVADDNEAGHRGRVTGICPVCQGRFRLRADGLVPNHAPLRSRTTDPASNDAKS